MVNYALPKVNDDFGIESLIEKRKEPIFGGIKDIHESLLKQNKDLSKKYQIYMAEYSVSKILYALYVQKGLLIKDMEYDGDLYLTNEQYFALRQFYYDCHATWPAGVFNVLSITVEWKDNKFDVKYEFFYNKSLDAEASSSVSSGISSDSKKLRDAGLTVKSVDFKPAKLV